MVASDSLSGLRAGTALPVRIRLDVRPEAKGQVAAALRARPVNGHAVELFCAQDAKMAVLARIGGLGDAVRDLDISLPSLEEIYRFYGEERPR